MGNNDLFDSVNYSNPNINPYVTENPLDHSSQVVGSNDAYYNHIIETVEPAALNYINGNTIFYLGSTFENVYSGMNSLLNENLSNSEYSSSKNWLGSSSQVLNEIDNNRPLIISISKFLGGINHWCVGYGYSYFDYVGTTSSYLGYIVHMG